jgi:hypothetical protein
MIIVDFTREPIIETIITPKEGYKLVVRSSKGTGQEEYFVDAVEVVAFGQAFFFRSLERPKSFLVPVVDYEIVEVREARMVLKNVGTDRSIKIGGGREGSLKAPREADKGESVIIEEVEVSSELEETQPQLTEANPETRTDARLDKKRDRRRHYRKRRGAREDKEENPKEEGAAIEPNLPPLEDEKISITPPEAGTEEDPENIIALSSNLLSSLLQPPPTLISETINRYRENALFKNAFFLTEDDQYKPHDKVHELLNENDDEDFAPPLQEPTYVPENNSQSNVDKEALVQDVEEDEWIQQESFVSDNAHHSTLALSSQLSSEETGEENRGESSCNDENSSLKPSEERDVKASLPLYADEDEEVMEYTSTEEKEVQDELISPEKEEKDTQNESVLPENEKNASERRHYKEDLFHN